MNYFSLAISGIGLCISLYVLWRTLIQERQNLQITILKTYWAPHALIHKSVRYIEFIGSNSSKLPISITGAILKFNNLSSINNPSCSAIPDSLQIYETSTTHNETIYDDQGIGHVHQRISNIRQKNSTALPFNINPLSAGNFTLAIDTQKFRGPITKDMGATLTLITNRKSIDIPIEQLLDKETELRRR